MAGREPTMLCGSGCCRDSRGDEIAPVDIYGDGMVVGIVGLKSAFGQLYAAGLRSKDSVGDQLLAMIKTRNHVPRTAEERYKAVLSREYATFCTEREKKDC